MKKNIFTKEEENKICEDFRNGKAGWEIADELNQKKFRIYEVLKRNGLRPNDNAKRRPSGKPEELLQQIVDYYNKPSTIKGTARYFGLPYGTVRKILAKKKVLRLDNGHKAVSDEILQGMIDQWNEGKSQTAIGKFYGISQSAVGRLLWKAGIQTSKRQCVGETHGSYKGGRCTIGNYIMILMPKDHPFFKKMANCSGYVMEHRFVMAEHLGRPLSRKETVHHINGDKKDNRLENLQLRTSNHGAGIVMKCRCCGSSDIETVEL